MSAMEVGQATDVQYPPNVSGVSLRQPPKIYGAISAIMGEMDAIGRDRENKEGGQRFKFRGIDDIYNTLQPLMAKHKVFTVPEVLESTRTDITSKSGAHGIHTVLKIRYTFFADDGSYFCAVLEGEAIDYGDKATNKAESAAHKYALTQVFAIRTEDLQDSDASTPDMGRKETRAMKDVRPPDPPSGIESEKFPWEKNKTTPLTTVKKEFPEGYIQKGAHAGLALKDKPSEFWLEYVGKVKAVLPDLNSADKSEAMSLIAQIEKYLGAK